MFEVIKNVVRTIAEVPGNFAEMVRDMGQGEYIDYLAKQLGFKNVEGLLHHYANLTATKGTKICPGCGQCHMLYLKIDKKWHCPHCDGPRKKS